ncbi:MAG: superoxide dismutase [Bacteroidales bacterium]|nr:superoxide dismutase [Bacteroidales bacterium]
MDSKIKELQQKYPFELPTLGYSYNSLEPNIDAMTMEIHLTKHHAAYVTNANNAIKGTDMEKLSIGELFKNMSKYPVAVRNNAGGHFNHTLFWQIMSPNGGGMPSGMLMEAIQKDFGSFEKFKEEFENAAKSRFGSGWAWLSLDENKKLFVSSTPNQDNPLMDVAEKKGYPILGIDVWEHAYYLKYQNRRPEYISNFWNVVNWKEVERRYLELIQ